MPNNFGSWSGGAPGEGILNDPAYWGLDVDGPGPEEEDEEDEEEEDETV
jgi:hypothetical protein